MECINTRDIYLRHTAPDGTSYVQLHRVWDADKFISSQQQEAVKENAKQENPMRRKANVEQITEEQYHAARHVKAHV